MIQPCLGFEKSQKNVEVTRVSTDYLIVWNTCLQRTTGFHIVVLGSIQLVGQSTDVLMGHRQPPRRLVQISLQPLPLISLLRDLLTESLMLKKKCTDD